MPERRPSHAAANGSLAQAPPSGCGVKPGTRSLSNFSANLAKSPPDLEFSGTQSWKNPSAWLLARTPPPELALHSHLDRKTTLNDSFTALFLGLPRRCRMKTNNADLC